MDIYQSFYNQIKSQTTCRTYKSLGSIETDIEQGINATKIIYLPKILYFAQRVYQTASSQFIKFSFSRGIGQNFERKEQVAGGWIDGILNSLSPYNNLEISYVIFEKLKKT